MPIQTDENTITIFLKKTLYPEHWWGDDSAEIEEVTINKITDSFDTFKDEHTLSNRVLNIKETEFIAATFEGWIKEGNTIYSKTKTIWKIYLKK